MKVNLLVTAAVILSSSAALAVPADASQLDVVCTVLQIPGPAAKDIPVSLYFKSGGVWQEGPNDQEAIEKALPGVDISYDDDTQTLNVERLVDGVGSSASGSVSDAVALVMTDKNSLTSISCKSK